MKRTLVLTLLALWGFTAANAQTPFATLLHNDTLQAFYGSYALWDAYNESTTGDIITLSPGTFTTFPTTMEIAKSITIRGAGMFDDTVEGTTRTVIDGNIRLNMDNITSTNFLTLEGLYFTNNIDNYDDLHNAVFNKCYMQQFISTWGNVINGQFINCIIEYAHVDNMTNCVFANSVIYYFSPLQGSNGTNSMINCVANADPREISHISCVNCILYSDIMPDWEIPSDYYTSIQYCIGINMGSSSCDYFHPYQQRLDLHNSQNMSSIFQEFTGTYTEGVTVNMALNATIATSILGSDGTQLGIYGGQYPFNPRVLNYSATVASQSRPDGKLEVTILPIND